MPRPGSFLQTSAPSIGPSASSAKITRPSLYARRKRVQANCRRRDQSDNHFPQHAHASWRSPPKRQFQPREYSSFGSRAAIAGLIPRTPEPDPGWPSSGIECMPRSRRFRARTRIGDFGIKLPARSSSPVVLAAADRVPGSWRTHRVPARTPLSCRIVRRSEAGPRRRRANRHSGNDAGGHVGDRGLDPRISRSVAVATPPLAVNAPHRSPDERSDIRERTRRLS